MGNMGSKTVGLDIGTNSIGWAIIEYDNQANPLNLVACGSRVFPEAVDAKTSTPKNQARRVARAARRLLARRKMRKNKVMNLLLQKGLLPIAPEEKEKIFSDNRNYDPYQLRKKGLDHPLEPFELGKVLYHLAHRRGFQSNRKTVSEEDGVVKTAINSLRQELIASGSRTLGEYLSNQPTKRNRYTDRLMYEEEFDLIWNKQQSFKPELSDGGFKVALHNAIFFQRPLKIQKNLVGICSFETSRKRAPKALLISQRFRILQDLNHLTVKNPISRNFRPLTHDERSKLLAILEKQKTLSWNKARTLLDLHSGETFNLEEGKKSELLGNKTAFSLRTILKDRWDEMPEKEKEALVTDMLTIDNPNGFLKRMEKIRGFDKETAEKLAMTELEPGYMKLSKKAIGKIVPFLEIGTSYTEASVSAGYQSSSNGSNPGTELIETVPQIRNPIVQKVLFETRKVMNSIIRKFGKPDMIRLEMARDMKLTKREKSELHKEQNRRKKENEQTRNILTSEFGIQNPTVQDIHKYRMWKECVMVCPYTGTTISREMLFSPEIEIEHILPYSRSLDDSYMNKTLCLASENRNIKHNKTPYEAYHIDEEKYQEILQRIRALPYQKKRRFEQKKLDLDKFVERQLNDTRYISVEVKNFLSQLGKPVEISKGEATAALRRKWGLEGILGAGEGGGKNRSDHRHHAIDAIVIGLTSRSLFQKLSRLSATSGMALTERGFPVETPWPDFRKDVEEQISNIVVSHGSRRKISDAFHGETAYGYIGLRQGKQVFAHRKPLSVISTKRQIETIADPKVKELVLKRLEDSGDDFKKAFGNPQTLLYHLDGKTPIRSVRLHVEYNPDSMFSVKDKEKPVKYFELGNNHHVEILENRKSKSRKGVFVTTLEAAKRARIDKTPIVQREHGPDWQFIMSLSINDILEIENEGSKDYFRVQKMSGPIKSIVLRHHSITGKRDSDRGILRKTPNSLKGKKVTVDCLGNILPCHD